MTDTTLESVFAHFEAATAHAGAERWNVRLELRYAGSVRTLELGRRAAARGPSLVVEVDDAATTALERRDLNAFWAAASVTGRFSHFAVVSDALFARLGQGHNEFAGAATRRDVVDSPAARAARAKELVRELRARHAPAAVERIAEMLRMWSDDVDVPSVRGRIADYAIPDARPRAWLDDERTMTSACVPLVSALREEGAAFGTGREIAPDYYDGSKTEGVTWGRLLLVAYDRPIPDDLRRRFPATMAALDAASATGRLLNACFLTMAPGHEILPHSDGNAAYASWHLGLVVPPGCGVRAGGEAREHAAGRWLAFDDSFTHSAWNRSDGLRVVLTGWAIHPDLRDDEAAAMVDLSKLLGWGI